MRRLVLLFVLVFLVCTSVPLFSYASSSEPEVLINVNGQRIHPDVAPIIRNDRTLVPLRGILEKLGAELFWAGEFQTVTILYKQNVIVLTIGSTTARVNGDVKVLDVAPMLYNDRTMVPLRFISENIGMQVQWIPETGVATVTDPSYFSTLPGDNVLGFTTNDYRGDDASYESLTKYSANISSIATFSYQAGSNGSLTRTGELQSDAVKLANSNNIKPLVLIHNMSGGSFSSTVAHALLTNETSRSKLISNLIVLMSREEYSGVNIDLEDVPYQDRQYYSTFIRELKEKLSAYGFLTTVSIPAKTRDYPASAWSGAFDYKEIGKYADQVLLMTYDEHYFNGDPGPVASLPWVENVIKYSVSVMPSNKVLLGIPAYGYDWSDSGRTKVVFFNSVNDEISRLGVKPAWDDNYKSPYYKYRKDGANHEVWYENTSSLSYKMELVSRYNLGGIGIWRLGYDNNAFWSVVNRY